MPGDDTRPLINEHNALTKRQRPVSPGWGPRRLLNFPPLMDPPKVQHHMEQFPVTEIRNCQIVFQSTVHSAFPPAANESFGYSTSSSAFSLVLFSVLAILIDE